MVLLARLACLFSPMSQCEASPGKCQQYFNNVSLQAGAAGQLISLLQAAGSHSNIIVSD